MGQLPSHGRDRRLNPYSAVPFPSGWIEPVLIRHVATVAAIAAVAVGMIKADELGIAGAKAAPVDVEIEAEHTQMPAVGLADLAPVGTKLEGRVRGPRSRVRGAGTAADGSYTVCEPCASDGP